MLVQLIFTFCSSGGDERTRKSIYFIGRRLRDEKSWGNLFSKIVEICFELHLICREKKGSVVISLAFIPCLLLIFNLRLGMAFVRTNCSEQIEKFLTRFETRIFQRKFYLSAFYMRIMSCQKRKLISVYNLFRYKALCLRSSCSSLHFGFSAHYTVSIFWGHVCFSFRKTYFGPKKTPSTKKLAMSIIKFRIYVDTRPIQRVL